MIKNAALCILGYLLTPAFAQQFPYPLPQTTSSSATSNPWGLQPLRKLSTTKPTTAQYQNPQTNGNAQQYVPPYYPPPPSPPTYLPSQLNPNSGWQPNYATPNYNSPNYNAPNYNTPTVAPPPSSDIWSNWKNNGGAFRYSPGVDFSSTYGDVVAAVNSMGIVKAKTVGPAGTSSWVSIAQPIAGTTGLTDDAIESRPAVVVNAGAFQVFVVTALGNVASLNAAAPLPLSQLTGPIPWKVVNSANTAPLFINNPAAVYMGSSYFVFAINRADRKIYYGTDASGSLVIANLLDANKRFIFSPTAATYLTNGANRVVVAAVTYDGVLNVYQTTAATATTLNSATFEATDVTCIDSPQSVGLGDRVEIYCRGKDMQFYCVTVMQGGISDTRVLPEADIPDTFDAVYNSMNYMVSVYSKTPAGRVVSKGFQLHKPVNYWRK